MKTREHSDVADDLLLPGDEGEPSRRAFLKLAGFGVASAALTGCSRGPAVRALVAPVAAEGTTPGVPYWIATTCGACPAGCGLLARCRDGRPVKLEGNPDHGLSQGGLCPIGQADVLSLYDGQRLDRPQQIGAARSWEEADAALGARLEVLRDGGGRLRLLTSTLTSPSTREAVARFLAGFPDARHVEVDALSAAAALDAHEAACGVRALPRVRLERARVVASFADDFLGTGVSPVEHAAGWAAGRRPDEGRMSRHRQLEATLSLTGGAADERVRLAPWETVPALRGLVDRLASLAGRPSPAAGAFEDAPQRAALERLAEELFAARGDAVVLCGANDLTAQLLAIEANRLLDSYGATLDLARPSLQRRGDDRAAAQLAAELEQGTVDVLLVAGANPAYDRPDLAPHLARAGLLVSFARSLDETAALADWVLPEPHPLEAWGDAEPVAGRWSLMQPTVPPLFSGRTLRETLARWSGDGRPDRELVEDHLRRVVHPAVAPGEPFDTFLVRARRAGWVERPGAGGVPAFRDATAPFEAPAPPATGLALVLYAKVAMRDGAHAHNPWLQELPDPLSRVVWDNYACLSPARAAALGLADGDVVRLTAAGVEDALELPVHVQPGQHDEVVAVALGYGRAGTDRFAGIDAPWLQGRPTVEAGGAIGVNAAPWLALVGGHLRGDTRAVELAPTGRRHELADLQDHDRMEVPPHLAPEGHRTREVVRRERFGQGHESGHGAVHGADHAGSLWPDDHPRPGHRWAMAVDLTACTGCSACVVGCQAENNVPVVGRDEVRRHREMHWLRIDRYYTGDDEHPGVSHQPMMCQHCDNAPCEAVCPVLATVHSSEGLNQQVYNRCVGTRYCANTCPYKVRRFNWFEYPREDELANHALNPDVAVRSRGVMEKCSFCAQRIQLAKGAARREGRPIADGEVQTACQQSCPTRAIVFGDLADPGSAVSRALASPRAYRVLEELNVQPSVSYLTEVRNAPAVEGPHAR